VAPPAPATPLKPAESVTVPATRLPGNAASLPSDLQNQLYLLKDQARQLQAEKQVLEAKLKEALAAQPATVDSREFANAQQKVDTLQKENDLLKTTLAQEKAKPVTPMDAKGLQKSPQALTEANRKLEEQTQKANALALEKQALQNKLDSLSASQSNAGTSDSTKKALSEANAKLARQTEIATRLASEKEALQSRVSAGFRRKEASASS